MASPLKPPDRRERLAVIDDDVTFLELMRELLQVSEGYEVHTSGRWDDVPAFVRGVEPDLVLLDIVMQGQEQGWAALEQLRRDPRTRAIPVLVCSAAVWSLREHEELLRRCNASVLAKPFDLATLLERVQALLDPSRSA
jgi:twitching motility two-component system response regulator PilH